jgi:dethiobiotin synthetase
MRKILVAGIGTDVGKTVVCSLLTHALEADYWKPVQCGTDFDRKTIEKLVPDCRTHPEAYAFTAPRSPHHAAKLEHITIDPNKIVLPQSTRPLIIEGCGGLFVPLNLNTLAIDLFAQWECEWILVSRHYVGNINHTLLTVEAMHGRSLKIKGIIFNGSPCQETEEAILKFSQVPCLARINQEPLWNSKTVHAYSKQKAFQSVIRN